MVATIVLVDVPLRGETDGSKSRLGPLLPAATGMTIAATRMTAAARALVQDPEPRVPLRRSLASTRERLLAGT
jgi:hypothetical protein